MAIACRVDRAPCSPRRISSISSRTNSPAWVDGDLPSRLSCSAFLMVRWSGITDPPCIAPRTDFQHAGSDIDPRPLAARRWADYSHGGQGFSEEDAMRRNLTAIGLVITMGI